jgi:hypothetical protein
MELWDAPSGIAIVSNNIEVVNLEERALTSIQSMRNTVMPILGDVNHSPKLAACCRARLRMCGGFPPVVMATKSPTRMKSSILLQKMPNGVDEGLTLGLPTIVIIACFCRGTVVWVFREILADVTRTIYTLSSTNGEHMFLVNQDELLRVERTVHPVKYPLPYP